MTLKEKITQYAKELNKNTFTLSQLKKRLGAQDKRELNAAVKRLIKEKVIMQQGRDKFALYAQGTTQGVLRGNKRGYAFLIPDNGEDIFISARALGDALHGDRVEVRLTGESEGEVVRILSEGANKLVGTFMNIGHFSFVRPDDACFSKDIQIPANKTLNAAPGDKVAVNITRNRGVFSGEVERILGQAGEIEAEILSILYSYGFEDNFPKEVIDASDALKFTPGNRLDLTALTAITIDGEDAKDFDDAISLERTGTGYRLYVHIADVAHYVKSGGIIDREAAKRATSVYFPGFVFPMLPKSISDGVCSLRADEDKLTLSVIMDFDDTGKQTDVRFAESVIRSRHRMTYTAVSAILAGDSALREKYKDILPLLENAGRLAALLEKRRKEEGMLDFVTLESLITVDKDLKVNRLEPYPYEVSNKIIEHFMIAANRAVAEFLSKSGAPCVYRVHEKVNEEKLEAFISFISVFGYSLNLREGITPKVFSDFLLRVKGEAQEQIINKVLLRSMQKAKYDIKNSGHFGLALADYCHFTSPIRRYPDLMVHRTLKAIINNVADDSFKARHAANCALASEVSSEREIAAERAERDAKDYFKALYMKDYIGETFEGTVSGVVNSGFFVMLDNTAEGFVSLDGLPRDRYGADLKTYRISGGRNTFSLCDRVRVRVKAASPSERRIDFDFIEKIDGERVGGKDKK
ncbi:MAG: ribonuclease R [Christensenellales bacterium]